jgi:hypothetical protein
MTSSQIRTVYDNLGYFPLPDSELNIMPNPPMITQFDAEGKVVGDRQGYWIEKYNDGHQLNHKTPYDCFDDQYDCLEIGNFATQPFQQVTGVNKLFHSMIPNTGHVSATEDQDNDGQCLQLRFNNNGKRQIILGSRYKSEVINNPSNECVWSSPTGVQFEWNMHPEINSSVNIVDMSFIVVVEGRSQPVHVPLVCRGKFKGPYIDVGDRGGLVEYKFVSYVPMTGKFYAYISDEVLKKLQGVNYVAIGMVYNLYCHGDASFDIFNFKLAHSSPSTKLRSELVLPAPHTVQSKLSSNFPLINN